MSEEWHIKLEKLARENKLATMEALEHLRVIRRRLFWSQFAAWLRLAVIAAPIILLLLWLPPRLKAVWVDYQSLRADFEKILDTAAPAGGMDLESIIGAFLGR